MICPDWQGLKRRPDEAESDAWRAAVRHLDRCDRCRAEALAIDPLLAFRRVDRDADGGPPVTEAEVSAMRTEVRAIVRSRSLAIRRPGGDWKRIAVAAGFAAILLTLGAVSPRIGTSDGGTDDLRSSRPTAAANEARLDLPPTSLVEDLDRPGARVYEMRQLGVSVVMIVDETLDV